MKWKSLRQVNHFQLCRESHENLSLCYICMLKENYWFQICNNENSLLVGYMFKLCENKSSKCALSHITRRDDILQAAQTLPLRVCAHAPRKLSKPPVPPDPMRHPPPLPSPGESPLTFSSFLMSPSPTDGFFFPPAFLPDWIWDTFWRKLKDWTWV